MSAYLFLDCTVIIVAYLCNRVLHWPTLKMSFNFFFWLFKKMSFGFEKVIPYGK